MITMGGLSLVRCPWFRKPEVSYPREVRVRTIEEFKRECEVEQRYVFRGQIRDFGSLTPSLYREKLPFDISEASEFCKNIYQTAYNIGGRVPREEIYYAREERLLEWLNELSLQDAIEAGVYTEWLTGDVSILLNAGLFSGFPEPADQCEIRDSDWAEKYRWIEYEWKHQKEHLLALLQHYGFPSPALDVTYDPEIALWFATHRFCGTHDGSAYYLPTFHQGIVYVMNPNGCETMLDLTSESRSLIPCAGLRGQRQQGAAVFGVGESNQDLSGLVYKKIIIEMGPIRKFGNYKMRQSYLFPPEKNDQFYGALLDPNNYCGPDYERFRAFIKRY